VTDLDRSQVLSAGVAGALAGIVIRPVHAQAQYPKRPIRVVVPFAAGGVGEAAMRVLGPRLERSLGQKLVIEPKPGAGGNIGTLEVARADADGYTVVIGAAGNFVINQFLMKMSFDPLTALAPVAKIAEIPIVFLSNPSLPVRTLPELVDYARAHPGKLNYASPGNGSVNHLLVESLKQIAGIEITHVPFRGSPPAAMALLANEVQLFTVGFAAVQGHLRDGNLTAIAVTTAERLPMLPGVPTVTEAGFPDLAILNWWAMAAPKQTPEPVIRLLSDAVAEALSDPTIAERYAAVGILVPTQTREQFIAGLRSEADRWASVIQRGRIAIE
jgi:tripartite-type tricarboxylate transporter receptor subunit TctC